MYRIDIIKAVGVAVLVTVAANLVLLLVLSIAI